MQAHEIGKLDRKAERKSSRIPRPLWKAAVFVAATGLGIWIALMLCRRCGGV